MSYFWIQYTKCTEDEFKNKDEALKAFIKELQDVDITNRGIIVRKFNEDTQNWETV